MLDGHSATSLFFRKFSNLAALHTASWLSVRMTHDALQLVSASKTASNNGEVTDVFNFSLSFYNEIALSFLCI